APVRASLGRAAADGAGRAREPRRGWRPSRAAHLRARAARDRVRMQRIFAKREHRDRAGVGAFEYPLPLRTRLAREHAREALAQHRPAGAVVLGGQRLARKSQALQELRIELGLDRAYREESAVARLVGVVPGRARVEDVDA